MTKKPEVDVKVVGSGTLYHLFVLTDLGRDWVKGNVNPGDYNPYFPHSVIVEHRYVQDLVEGMKAAGLTVA